MSVHGVERIQKALQNTLDTAANPEQIRNVAAYMKRSLHNAPNHRPPKKKKKMDAQNKVYFPDNNGGIKDSGMTVSEYLKVIKGGYRATGAGYRRVRYYGHPDRQSVGVREFPWAEVHRWGSLHGTTAAKRLARSLERKTELRGTGKVSEAEYKKLEKIQKRRDAILHLTTAGIRALEYNLKSAAELRKKEIEINHDFRLSRKVRGEDRKRYGQRVAKLKNDLQRKRERQRVKNQEAARKFEEKNRRYRIVVPSTRGGYVAEMMAQTLVVPGAKPGKPPYTRERPGFYNKYIAKKWKTEQRGKDIIIALTPGPDMPDTRYFLKHLEYGGSEKNSKLIVGYVIEFRDNDAKGRKFSHRRIAIKPLFTYGGMSQISAHPFVVPTVAAVQKKLNKPSTARPILKGEL